MNIIETLKKYSPKSSINEIPIIWQHCTDSEIVDINGNKYIDFSSGIFVTNIGHSSTNNAIRKQLIENLSYSYNYPTEIRAKYLKTLIEFCPDFVEKAFLLSSGSEAVDCAIKIMRLYGKSINKNKDKILCFNGAMHGKTMCGYLLTGNYSWATEDNNMVHLLLPHEIGAKEPNWLPNIKYDNICGIIIESYQGWSGKFFNSTYIQNMVDNLRRFDILICFDEVQGGFGRTGKKFAYEHYNVEPDLLVLGKGMGNGFPLSAIVGRSKLLDIPIDLSSTYSGNPLACASGLEVIKIIKKKNLIKESERKGKILESYLQEICQNTNIIYNCKGLLGALIFDNEEIATKICNKAKELGLILVHTGKRSIKIGPPLVISDKLLEKGCKILRASVKLLNLQ